MQTRDHADFYLDIGTTLQWCGSVLWLGDPATMASYGLIGASTGKQYRAALASIEQSHPGAVSVEYGWPWPWDSSCGTTYAYMFRRGRVWLAHHGFGWAPADDPVNNDVPLREIHFTPLGHLRKSKNVEN